MGVVGRLLVLGGLAWGLAAPAAAADLMAFWATPQRGANSFNRAPPDQDYFTTLQASGATWVRLAYGKWDSAERDFLLGNADAYTALVAADLKKLRQALDRAEQAGLNVVVAPLSLPGARWVQNNAGEFDDRLWSQRRYWQQAAAFWRDLAAALKDHPAVAAYNVVNEPAPERTQPLRENASVAEIAAFMAAHENTARDLPLFYRRVIAAIREVDAVTPVMVDGGYYANPRHLAAWRQPLADEKVLYAFHMYEPYSATSAPNRKRSAPLRYPGVETVYAGATVRWDRQAVHNHIGTAFDWARGHGLPATRLVAAEFGCARTWADCAAYLTDVLDGLEAHGAHWAFYAFRSDDWEAMDYEIPATVAPGRYYWLREQGRPQRIPRGGALFELIRQRMAP